MGRRVESASRAIGASGTAGVPFVAGTGHTHGSFPHAQIVIGGVPESIRVGCEIWNIVLHVLEEVSYKSNVSEAIHIEVMVARRLLWWSVLTHASILLELILEAQSIGAHLESGSGLLRRGIEICAKAHWNSVVHGIGQSLSKHGGGAFAGYRSCRRLPLIVYILSHLIWTSAKPYHPLDFLELGKLRIRKSSFMTSVIGCMGSATLHSAM